MKMKIVNSSPYLRYFLLFIFLFQLTACADKEMTDLEGFVAETKARKNPHVDEIPEFKINPGFFYEVETMRDPFKELITNSSKENFAEQDTNEERPDCQRPDIYRTRVELETMPLDSLQMVGTLEDEEGNYWGIITSRTDGTLYRLQAGDYIGENFGQVMSISEERIDILELHSDGAGCWIEQNASIALYSSE